MGMPDQELLSILKTACEVVKGQQMGRKFDSNMTKLTGTLNCKTHTGEDYRSDRVGISNNNPNMSDYFRSNANIGADKKPSDSLHKNTQQI